MLIYRQRACGKWRRNGSKREEGCGITLAIRAKKAVCQNLKF